MSEELETLRIVATRLEAAGIPFMLTGSVAMAWYAQPRQTRDIDIVIELPPTRVRDIVSMFAPDFYVDEDAVRDAVIRGGMFNIIHETFIVKVDLILRKAGAYALEAFRRRRRVLLAADIELDIISAEDLLLATLELCHAGESELHLRDVRNLLASVANIDHAYLDRWAPQLGATGLLPKGGDFISHDTPPDVQTRYRNLILARPPQARVAMCFEMSTDSRQIAGRSLIAAGHTGSGLRRALLERLYGTDLAPEAFAKCLARLERAGTLPVGSQ